MTWDTDFHHVQQLKRYTKNYTSPTQMQPMPLGIYFSYLKKNSTGFPKSRAIADLHLIVFFFMLRPDEYCSWGSDVLK